MSEQLNMFVSVSDEGEKGEMMIEKEEDEKEKVVEKYSEELE
ncbi:hypothetical protein [Staphylococcus epidermidis]